MDRSKYIIQVWTEGTNELIPHLLTNNFRLIMSNSDAWYLDCGYGSWIWNGQGPDNNWCSPFKGWKTVYMNSPRDMARFSGVEESVANELILGGEAAMWSEQVDEHAVEAKLWPRGSALAERLWSDPRGSSAWKSAEQRLLQHRHRMVKIHGIRADAIQPEFCRIHDGYCYAEPAAGNVPWAASGGVADNAGGAAAAANVVRLDNLGLDEIKQLRLERNRSLKTSSSQLPESYAITLAVIVMIFVLLILKRRFFLTCLSQIIDIGRRFINILSTRGDFRFINIR